MVLKYTDTCIHGYALAHVRAHTHTPTRELEEGKDEGKEEGRQGIVGEKQWREGGLEG